MKQFLRSIQTYFPFLHDLRFTLQFLIMKCLRKPHEEDFKAIKQFTPEKGEVFVDIGTNRGESLLSMDLMNGDKNQIIGFEPNPHVYERAEKAVIKKKHIRILNVGLSDKIDQIALNVPFYRKWMFDGLSSFDYDSASNWLKNRLWQYREKNFRIKKIKCQINILDNYELNPYFIKIDVQGLEYQVLQGAEKTIEKHRPILLIESIENRILQYLNGFGYEYFSYRQGTFKKGIGKLNTFCIPEEKKHTLTIAA